MSELGSRKLEPKEVNHVELPSRSCIRMHLPALAFAVLAGCASLSPQERDTKRAELDAMGDKAITTLLETRPQAQASLDRSLGYAILDMAVTKIPWFGAGRGTGLVVDKRSNARSYLKVSRFDVGGGLGAQKYKVVILFFDEKLLGQSISGGWHFDAGAEAGAGTVSAEGTTAAVSQKGYEAYKLVEGGAVATVTVRVAYAEPYLK